MQSHNSDHYTSLHIEEPLFSKINPQLSEYLHSIFSQISSYMGDSYQFIPQCIPIHEDEDLMTFFLKSEKNSERTFYLGHGFGGTSLMYFPNFVEMLNYGNILLWQMRGMGVSHKLNEYKIKNNVKSIKEFFMEGLHSVIQHYRHQKIVLVAHSFAGYITMSYLLQQPYIPSIQSVILLSPVGITPKNIDYKNKVRSCSDFKNLLLAKFGWKFNLSYKSPMRTICCCCKEYLFLKGFKCLPLNQKEVEICAQLFLLLVNLPDGSDHLFFRCFHPRVLPHQSQSIQQMVEKGEHKYSYKTSIYYGGQKDWVDKKGAEFLAQKFQNINIILSKNDGHMMPLYPQFIKSILQNQFASINIQDTQIN